MRLSPTWAAALGAGFASLHATAAQALAEPPAGKFILGIWPRTSALTRAAVFSPMFWNELQSLIRDTKKRPRV